MSDDKGAVLITGKCTINDGASSGDYGVQAVKAQIGLNNWPSALVQILDSSADETGKAVIIDETVFLKIGKWLNNILDGSLKGSVEWEAGDVKLRIDGFISTVGQSVQYGNMCAEIVLLPEYAVMDVINMQQYRITLYTETQLNSCEDSVPELGGSGLMDYIKKTIEKMLQMWELKWNNGNGAMCKNLSEHQKDMFNAQHNKNKELINKFLYPLLENSKDAGAEYTGNNMKVLGKESVKSLYLTILTCLTSSQGSFLSALVALANQFRLVYCPEMNAVGKFISKSDMVYGTPEDSKVQQGKLSIVQSRSTSGGTGYFPVKAVITTLDYNSNNLNSRIYGMPLQGGAAYVASGLEGGRTICIAPPMWIPRKLNLALTKQDGTSTDQKMLGPTDWVTPILKNLEMADKSDKQYFLRLLNLWCLQELCQLLIGGSMTTLSTFLDELKCGARVNTEFGSGFITGCIVNIALNNNGRGDAKTSYTYSHVIYKGAKMPEIKWN